MTEVYVAEKSPHSNGRISGAFWTLEEAHEWLEGHIEAEPEVEEWELQENPESMSPAYTYVVKEGKGKVTGTIGVHEFRGDVPTGRLDKEHHNAPKDGNDDPVLSESENPQD